MRSAIIDGPGIIDFVESVTPVPADDEVLVRIAYVGLCGTDGELYEGRSPYLRDGRASFPHSFGHEWVGAVEGVGSQVRNFSVGDTVTASTMITCRECAACVRGDANLCEALREIGLYDWPGAAAERIVVPAHAVASFPNVEPQPRHVLAEPLVTVLEALERGRVKPKDRVLVVGAGTIGSLALIVLESMGILPDVVDPRGCKHVPVSAERCHLSTETCVGLFDVAIEASGAPQTARQAMQQLRPGGRLLLVGVPVQGAELDAGELVLAGIETLGIRHGVDHYTRATALIEQSPELFDQLVNTPIPMSDLTAAFRQLRDGNARPKVVVFP